MTDVEAATREDLLARGLSRRALALAVSTGSLIRARRNWYVSAAAPTAVVEAVRIGGRLTCLSLLQLLEVFVHTCSVVHAHITPHSSRLRSPHNAGERIAGRRQRRARLHWMPLVRPDDATASRVGLVDALIHSVLCQPPRHAIATLDSALNKGLIELADLADVFTGLPPRFRVLRDLVDGRAQSGPETLMRLMLRSLGCSVELQVEFEDVGFVDLVVDGWLVIECDSKAFHEDWQQQLKDRRRDLTLASYGYVTLRVTAEQILYQPELVLASVRGLIEAQRARTGC